MIINVNGIKLNYELIGNGKPIIFLHGNSESHAIFLEVANMLSTNYACYLIDSRCHGNSSKTKELHYIDMAQDIDELINELKISQPIVVGFSDGGIVALLLVTLCKKNLGTIFALGANIHPSGLQQNALRLFKLMHFFTRSKMLRLMINEPNISIEQLKSISNKVVVVCGEKDLIKQSHSQQIADAIPNSTFVQLNGETHSSYIKNTTKLYDLITSHI